MTGRIPLDALTSDALDALYEQLEAAEDSETQRQLATAREALASATTRAAGTAAVLREVLALFTPLSACANDGTVLTYSADDVIPAARMDRWRVVLDGQQRDEAQAAIARVRQVAARIRQGAPWTANDDDIADHIEAALKEPTP